MSTDNLIRQDLVKEFISYINRQNISPMSKIPSSIFETNQFLIGKNPTLIEYASFFWFNSNMSILNV